MLRQKRTRNIKRRKLKVSRKRRTHRGGVVRELTRGIPRVVGTALRRPLLYTNPKVRAPLKPIGQFAVKEFTSRGPEIAKGLTALQESGAQLAEQLPGQIATAVGKTAARTAIGHKANYLEEFALTPTEREELIIGPEREALKELSKRYHNTIGNKQNGL